MSYELAVSKAWEEFLNLRPEDEIRVRFLSDEYSVNLNNKEIIYLSSNVPAKDYTAILILHYLTQRSKGLPTLANEWVSFKELSGIEGYYPTFRKRAIEPIIKKYGSQPERVLTVLDRLPAKRIKQGDMGVILEVFKGVPLLVMFWRGDEEFAPEANILFDKSIAQIFCTEDIIVLTELTIEQL